MITKPIKELDILESVIDITEQRDRHSLEKNLPQVLYNLIDCDSIIFLKISGFDVIKHIKIAVCIPDGDYRDQYDLIKNEYGDLYIKPNQSITSCINEKIVISSIEQDKTDTLYPIVINNTVMSILDIRGFKSSPKQKRRLDALIDIYSNIISILNDNEKDTLTGLLNRKTYDEKLISMLSELESKDEHKKSTETDRRDKQYKHNFWLGILDIDHFKIINDSFGHLYGDEILLHFSNLMKTVFRDDDLLFRYGGEEFVVVIRPSSERNVINVFERFRKKLKDYPFPRIVHVTVSIGIVEIESNEHPSIIFEKADKALYYAKENGRDQVCDYNELNEKGLLQQSNIESDIELF